MLRSRTFSPQAEREVVDELMRRDLTAFVRRSFETVVPGETLRRNWHIRAMAHALEGVRRGKIKRLIITIPPPVTLSPSRPPLHSQRFSWGTIPALKSSA